jgi:hypothetical protein
MIHVRATTQFQSQRGNMTKKARIAYGLGNTAPSGTADRRPAAASLSRLAGRTPASGATSTTRAGGGIHPVAESARLTPAVRAI